MAAGRSTRSLDPRPPSIAIDFRSLPENSSVCRSMCWLPSLPKRVAVLWNPANRVFQMQMIHETEAAARPLGVQLRMFEARDAESIERAFAAISKDDVSGPSRLCDRVRPKVTLTTTDRRLSP